MLAAYGIRSPIKYCSADSWQSWSLRVAEQQDRSSGERIRRGVGMGAAGHTTATGMVTDR